MNSAVLDTHILVWWLESDTRLSRSQLRYLEKLEDKGGPFVISAITLWELAKLASAGRITASQPLDIWLREIETHPMIQVEPLSSRVLAESAQLQGFHKDPADQIIAATAICLGLPLVTSDDRIRKWGGVTVV